MHLDLVLSSATSAINLIRMQQVISNRNNLFVHTHTHTHRIMQALPFEYSIFQYIEITSCMKANTKKEITGVCTICQLFERVYGKCVTEKCVNKSQSIFFFYVC